MMRRRLTQRTPLEDGIADPPPTSEHERKALPPNSEERQRMERRARVAEVGAHINEWLTSPGLQAPK
jgi:hypothetical protein